MDWVLEAFEKYGDALYWEVDLSEDLDDPVIRSLVGARPGFPYGSFPMEGDSLSALASFSGIEAQSDRLDRFVMFYRKEGPPCEMTS